EVLGEANRAVCDGSIVEAAYGPRRATDPAQIDIEIFDLGADRVGEGVFDASTRRPAERRGWGEVSDSVLELDVAQCTAGRHVKQEMRPRIAGPQSEGGQPINPGLAPRAGRLVNLGCNNERIADRAACCA